MERTSTETVSPGSAKPFSEFLRIDPGVTIAGRYEIRSFLGSGGAAVVYAARDGLLGTDVALKILRPDRATDTAAARLRREVNVAHQISNEHVVRVFDIGESDYGLFVTMELVEGESLRDRIARSRLSVDETMEVALALLDALAAVHRIGVVHRDVKPSNVLVDRAGVVKLADLGLARTSDPDDAKVTMSDAVVGTMEYLAPEQALGKDVDARTDLYAFGVLLFECLTGQLPFGERSSVRAALAHIRERPRNVRNVRPEVPRWLSAIIAKLLEKNPARRYASAAEVAEALRRRKAPFDWRRIAMVAFAAGALASGSYGIRAALDTKSDVRLEKYGDDGFSVVDANGSILWYRKDVHRRHASLLRTSAGEWVAIVGPEPQPAVGRSKHRLLLLDPETGGLDRVVHLPDHLQHFTSFSDDFRLHESRTVDIDHDGSEELILTFIHIYYPSYTILYDARRNEARSVLISAGHHSLQDTADVTGDGRDELIFGGINNRLGWYYSLAAVNVVTEAEIGGEDLTGTAAVSPDMRESWGGRDVLVWYVLLPQGYHLAGRPKIDPARRVITVAYTERNRKLNISFDGFILTGGSPATASTSARTMHRAEAYRWLREVQAIARDEEFARDAIGAAEEARKHAAAAADPYLLEWTYRIYASRLVTAGKGEEALRLIESPVISPEVRDDVRYELAVEFHRRGELEKAVSLYRRGAFGKSRFYSGRLPYEFLEGAVFALCETGDYDRAAALVEEFTGLPTEYESAANWNYVALVSGHGAYRPMVGLSHTEFRRYLVLEIEAASTSDPGALLQRVKDEVERDNPQRAGLESLASLLASRAGDAVAARDFARAALKTIERQRADSFFARSHASFVKARAAAVGVTKP